MGRYRSVQSIMLAEALKGITDNQTITAYKKDCKLFAAYCKEQGVKRPDQLQGKEKELLQGYEKQLEASGYSPATIHRRLAAPCKASVMWGILTISVFMLPFWMVLDWLLRGY